MEVFRPTGLVRGAIEGSRVALKPVEYRYHDDLAVAGAGAPSGDGCRRVELKADVENLLKIARGDRAPRRDGRGRITGAHALCRRL